jgi:hypothetical protein
MHDKCPGSLSSTCCSCPPRMNRNTDGARIHVTKLSPAHPSPVASKQSKSPQRHAHGNPAGRLRGLCRCRARVGRPRDKPGRRRSPPIICSTAIDVKTGRNYLSFLTPGSHCASVRGGSSTSLSLANFRLTEVGSHLVCASSRASLVTDNIRGRGESVTNSLRPLGSAGPRTRTSRAAQRSAAQTQAVLGYVERGMLIRYPSMASFLLVPLIHAYRERSMLSMAGRVHNAGSAHASPRTAIATLEKPQ